MKRPIHRIMSIILTVAITHPLSSNALDPQVSFNSDSLKQTLEGFTELDNCDFIQWVKLERAFMNEDCTHIIGFHKCEDQIFFTLTEGVELQEIAEFVSLYYGSSIMLTTNGFFGNVDEDFAVENADIKTQVSICDSLKENKMITDCRLVTQRYIVTDYYGIGVNQYLSWYLKYEEGSPICEENGVPKHFSTIDSLSKYIETDLEGYDVREINNEKEKTTYVELVPPEGTTLIEQIDVATKIANELQIYPCYGALETTVKTIDFDSSIDLFNAVKGDANCDGKATIADSVAILQSLANNDKYPLSTQGSFNGDVSGDYDGITVADARTLQEWDANKFQSNS